MRHCEERLKLERVVISAIQALYAAKQKDRGAVRLAKTVKALEEHTKQHGCKPKPTEFSATHK